MSSCGVLGAGNVNSRRVEGWTMSSCGVLRSPLCRVERRTMSSCGVLGGGKCRVKEADVGRVWGANGSEDGAHVRKMSGNHNNPRPSRVRKSQ